MEDTEKEKLKAIWAADAEQQRRDNLKKMKVFKTRKVDIKFGGKKSPKKMSRPQSSASSVSQPDQDSYLRQQLGL